MPLLKAGPEIFPTSIFELPEAEFPWWVAHVRSRQDKALGRYLLPLEIPFYLPQRQKSTCHSGRTRVSYLPLFPGYLFFRGSAALRQAVLRSNLTVRILPVFDQGLLTLELRQLQALRESGAVLTPYPPIAPGDPVRIVDGPFQGYRGVVLRERGGLRLLVSVSVLRKVVAVEFERDVLASVHPQPRSAERLRSAVA
jgi:hypothetical protein